jgi:hypothetical protein
MRLSFLASKSPGYRALRAQSQGWAQVWQIGHGFVWICVLSAPGVIAVWWVLRDDPEPHRNVVWSLFAPVLVVAAIGVALKRYAIKKGRASDATMG